MTIASKGLEPVKRYRSQLSLERIHAVISRFLVRLKRKLQPPVRKVSVLIQTSDGKQFLVAPSQLCDRHGNDCSVVKVYDSFPAAITRVMQMLNIDGRRTAYKIVKVPNLGPNRKQFVVWFPQRSEFNPDHHVFNHEMIPVDSSLFVGDEREKKALQYVCRRAVRMQAERQEALAS